MRCARASLTLLLAVLLSSCASRDTSSPAGEDGGAGDGAADADTPGGGDADRDADADADTPGDGDADRDANADTGTHADGDAHADAYGDADTDAGPDVDASADGGLPCVLNGVVVPHGDARTFFRKAEIPHEWEQPCSDYGLVRTCRDGVLDGGEPYGPTGEVFDHASCEVEQVFPLLSGELAALPWELVWSDEFAQDKGGWEYQDSPAWFGGYRVPDNATIADGLLRITNVLGSRPPYPEEPVDREPRPIVPSSWESAHMWTERSFTYGYFEASLRFAAAQSIDNAFWLMTEQVGPEIDIVEGFWWAERCDDLHATIHMRLPGDPSEVLPAFSAVPCLDEDLAADFHLFGLVWTEDEIVWFYDGAEIFRAEDEAMLAFFFDQPLRVRLSTAISDMFTAEGLLPEADGTEMTVDYVRVYQLP